MDERGTQYGDLLRDHLKDSGLLGLLKTEISFQTEVSAAPAVRQERDRVVEQSEIATPSRRLKEIIGIVTSLPDSLDVSRGSYCGDGLRDILQESGILDLSLSDRPAIPASNSAPPPPLPVPRHNSCTVQPPCRRAVSSTIPNPSALRSQRLTGPAPRPPLRRS